MARGQKTKDQKKKAARVRQVKNESPPARRNASQRTASPKVIRLYPELIEAERAEVDAEFAASRRKQEREQERKEAPRVATVAPLEPKVQVISVQKLRDSSDYSDDYTENQFAI